MAQVPTLLTEGSLRGQEQPRADANDFGYSTGRAIQGVGAQLDQGLAAIQQLAGARQHIENSKWVNESIEQEKNYINKWMADPTNNSKESFPDDLQKLYKDRLSEYEKSSPNQAAKQDFRGEFGNFMTQRYDSALHTAASTKINNAVISVTDSIENAMDSYRTARTVTNVDASAELIGSVRSISGRIDSMFGQIAPDVARKLRDQVITDAAYASMDYSPELARKVLDMGDLEGRARHAIETQIQSSENSRNAFEIAQFEEQRKNWLTSVEQGRRQDKIGLSVYQSIFPRDQANAHKLRDDALIDIYNGTNDFVSEVSTWNPAEQFVELNKLKEGVGKDQTTAYRDDKIHELATQRIADNIRQIRADPVGYLVSNNPAIRAVVKRLEMLPEDQRSAQTKPLYDLLLRYQGPPPQSDTLTVDEIAKEIADPSYVSKAREAGGTKKQFFNVPRNSVSLLSTGDAEKFAAQVNHGSPKDALKTISGVLDQFPEEYRAIVFNDMIKLPGEKGIRGEFWAAVLNKDASWIDDYLGAVQNADAVKKGSTEKLADFDTALDTNSDWLTFRNPLASDNFQHQNIVEDFRGGIMLYAMALSQRRGLSPNKAVKLSIDSLLKEQIGTTSVNGKTVTVPRDQGGKLPHRTDEEVRDIGRRLGLGLKFVRGSDVKTTDEFGRNIFPALKAAGTDAVHESSLEYAIHQNGVFQTTPDGKAAVLYYDDGINHFEVRDKDNRAFMIQFSELPKFEPVSMGHSMLGSPGVSVTFPRPGPHVTEEQRIDKVKSGGGIFPETIDSISVGTGIFHTNWPATPWLRREKR